MSKIGVLLPRDFLERQPLRWQKSQRKRGALRQLKRLKEKRERLEEQADHPSHTPRTLTNTPVETPEHPRTHPTLPAPPYDPLRPLHSLRPITLPTPRFSHCISLHVTPMDSRCSSSRHSDG